jgi:hypothetical protein
MTKSSGSMPIAGNDTFYVGCLVEDRESAWVLQKPLGCVFIAKREAVYTASAHERELIRQNVARRAQSSAEPQSAAQYPRLRVCPTVGELRKLQQDQVEAFQILREDLGIIVRGEYDADTAGVRKQPVSVANPALETNNHSVIGRNGLGVLDGAESVFDGRRIFNDEWHRHAP